MKTERKHEPRPINMRDWQEDRERQQRDERRKGGALWRK